MRSVEVSAKTREEAIEAALLKLKAERHEVAVEVVSEGSSGFLGFGARNWTVRVTMESAGEEESFEDDDVEIVSEARPRQTEGRSRGGRDRNRRGGSRRGGDRGEVQGGDRAPERSGNVRAEGRSDRPNDRSGERRPDRGESRPERGGERRPDRGESRPDREQDRRPERGESRPDRGGDRRPDRGESRPDRNQDRRADRGSSRGEGPRENGNRQEARPPREQAPRPVRQADPDKVVSREIDERDREAAALLQELIQRMGIAATVNCRKMDDGATCLNVESEDSAILIGRKGKTLSAMQYLINRIVRRTEEGEEDRMVVDIENYLERRQQALEDLALRMADRAKESGRRVRVKPLSPQERRIIHLTLQDDPDVRTFSVGDSAIRSVVIAPKNEKPQSDRPRRSGGGRGRGGRSRHGRGPNGGGDNANREGSNEPREATAN